jgi:hypothetical protein
MVLAQDELFIKIQKLATTFTVKQPFKIHTISALISKISFNLVQAYVGLFVALVFWHWTERVFESV